MTTAEIILGIVLFAVAALLVIAGIRSFQNRGYLFNNAYIYASEEERKTMDKRPYYRQSGVVFLLLGLLFTIIGISVVLQNGKICLLEVPVGAAAIIYAIASSVQISRNGKDS